MVARSGTDRVATPGPPYSITLPTPPLTLSRRSSSRMTSLADTMGAVSYTHLATGYSVAAYGLVPWSKDNLDAIERGWILKADTLEELAEKIKADPENRDMITAEQLRQSV